MPAATIPKRTSLQRCFRALIGLVLGYAPGALVDVLGLFYVMATHSPRNHVEPHAAFGMHYPLAALGLAYGASPGHPRHRQLFVGLAALLLVGWVAAYEVFEIRVGG